MAFGLPLLLIIVLNVVGSLTDDEDPGAGTPITYGEPLEPQDAVRFGPDPRTAEGLAALAAALVAETGSSRVTWARLTADTATVDVMLADGEVRTYGWGATWNGPVHEVDPPDTPRGGAAFDLAEVRAEAFTPLVARMQDRLAIGPQDPQVTLHHLPGARTFVEVSGVSATHSGVLRATADGTLVDQEVEPLR